jgi:hypothetical protein
MSLCPVLDGLFAYADAHVNENSVYLQVDFTTYLLTGGIVRGNGAGTISYIPAHINGVLDRADPPRPPTGDPGLPVPTPASFSGPVTYALDSQPPAEPTLGTVQITAPLTAEFTYSVAYLIQGAEVWAYAPACTPDQPESVIGGVLSGVSKNLFIAMLLGDVTSS